MEPLDIEGTVQALLEFPAQTTLHRAAISAIATRRRTLATALAEAVGPTEAAKRIGVSRQVLWQILNPQRAQAIKRRSARARPIDNRTASPLPNG